VNYGFATYESIPVLGLDAAFFAVYTIAFFATLIFLNEPNNKNLLIFAGILVGVSFWGRGNSAPTIALVLFIPLIWSFFEKRVYANLKLSIHAVAFLLIVTIFATYFYYCNWQPLNDYYLNHQTFYERHQWNIHDAKKWLLNIPGFLFWRHESSFVTVMLTILSHSVFFALSIFPFKRSDNSKGKLNLIRMLSAAGGFIYFGQFFINVYFFTDPLFSLQNVLLIYRPMVLGMALLVISLILYLHFNKGIDFSTRVIAPSLSILLVLALTFTWLQTPWSRNQNLMSPKDLEKWSIGLNDMIGEGAVNILYYSHINPQIINYYRLKHNLAPMNTVYNPPGYDRMWSASDHSDNNKKSTLDTIDFILKNATVVLIPEKMEMYKTGPYAFYKFSEEWISLFESSETPEFVVIDKIKDYHGDVLVLMNKKLAEGRGTPLQLPLGKVDD
jgi:hypothetical protein